jgi:hypothetical protein
MTRRGGKLGRCDCAPHRAPGWGVGPSVWRDDCARMARRRSRNNLTGGEAGIRTLDTGVSPYNGLANRRLQPLGHLTAARNLSIRQALSYGTTAKGQIVPEIVPAGSQNQPSDDGDRAVQSVDPNAAVFLPTTIPATDWRARISSHVSATTFLVGRGSTTGSVRGSGARTGR